MLYRDVWHIAAHQGARTAPVAELDKSEGWVRLDNWQTFSVLAYREADNGLSSPVNTGQDENTAMRKPNVN